MDRICSCLFLTHLRSRIMVFLLSLITAGCSVGPDYTPPDISGPTHWLEEEHENIHTEPADLTRWWEIFDDPVLNNLVMIAYAQNPDLHIAGLRILEARAQLGILIGNQFPQQQRARGNVAAVGASENSANTVAEGDFRYGEVGVGFDAAWEMDFWGKFRRAVNSGEASLEGSLADYDNTLVTLTAEVARTYILLRTLESRLAIAKENVAIQERSLQIANVRFQNGDVTELDVAQAITLLSNTRASLPNFESQIRQAQNGLALLLGVLPAEIAAYLGSGITIPATPVEVTVGIPANALRRRPDIRRSERAMLAQSELIGVAKADLYPHFSLVGTIGLRSTDSSLTAAGFPGGSSLDDLFDSSSFEYSAGPSFSWDILNYGRIKNSVRIEDARFQQLVEAYRNTVLRAAQEVEDGLISFLRSLDEQVFLQKSAQAASRSVNLAMLQYREGLADYQRVIETQRTLVDQQDLVTANEGTIAINLISLYKALGGGWETQVDQPIIPDEMQDQMRERTNWGSILPDPATSGPVEREDIVPESNQYLWVSEK